MPYDNNRINIENDEYANVLDKLVYLEILFLETILRFRGIVLRQFPIIHMLISILVIPPL
jgi:hypothetical protein